MSTEESAALSRTCINRKTGRNPALEMMQSNFPLGITAFGSTWVDSVTAGEEW